MGMPRKKFWLIVGPLIAIFVIGVAIGLGVGLGTRKDSTDESPRFVFSITLEASLASMQTDESTNHSFLETALHRRRR